MTLREQYPNGPLQLVAAEFRFPLAPTLGSSAFERLSDTLREKFPLPEKGELQTIRLVPGNPFNAEKQKVNRFLTLSRTTAITVSETRAVVETTEYEGWHKFRPLIELALAVIGDHGPIVGLERLGLRYINEIRLPQPPGSIQAWKEYVNPQLVAAVAAVPDDYETEAFQGLLQVATGNQMKLLLRFGPLKGHVVTSKGPLRLKRPAEEGPFFLVDIDSYRVSSGDFDEYETESALKRFDGLHTPVHDFFEGSITERLRQEVLRGEQ